MLSFFKSLIFPKIAPKFKKNHQVTMVGIGFQGQIFTVGIEAKVTPFRHITGLPLSHYSVQCGTEIAKYYIFEESQGKHVSPC
jgi:hypothetical protein